MAGRGYYHRGLVVMEWIAGDCRESIGRDAIYGVYVVLELWPINQLTLLTIYCGFAIEYANQIL